jgi:hypothetical protein
MRYKNYREYEKKKKRERMKNYITKHGRTLEKDNRKAKKTINLQRS